MFHFTGQIKNNKLITKLIETKINKAEISIIKKTKWEIKTSYLQEQIK